MNSDTISGGVDLGDGTRDGTITLGDGADRFDGRGGHLNGHMEGGPGDDVYVIDDAPTFILEDHLAIPNSGRVESSVSLALPDNIEALIPTCTAALRGTGTNENNGLTSNSGDSTLVGRGGNDLILGGIMGGHGDDRLEGGFGNDVIYSNEGDDTAGNDPLQSFDGADSLTDGTTNAVLDRITVFPHGDDLGALTGTLIHRGTGRFVASGPQPAVVQGASTRILIDLNGNSTVDVKLMLTGNIALQSSDFILLTLIRPALARTMPCGKAA